MDHYLNTRSVTTTTNHNQDDSRYRADYFASLIGRVFLHIGSVAVAKSASVTTTINMNQDDSPIKITLLVG